MGRFLARRLLVTILVVLVTSIVAFSLVHLSGDPAAAMAGEGASHQDVEAIRRLYGFDRPLPVQYAAWLGKILTGEFGRSYYLRESVVQVLAEHAPITATLGLLALGFALLLAIPLGVLAGLHRGRAIDRLAAGVAVTGQAAPSFLLALLLIYIFGVWLHWLPMSADWPEGAGALTQLEYLILPSLPLVLVFFGYIARVARAGTIEALDADYTRTAILKGLPMSTVMRRHVLRNALLPTITVVASLLGYLAGGLVVIETLFHYRGIGALIYSAARAKDFPMLEAGVLTVGAVYAIASVLADLLSAALNPRLRAERT